MVMDKIALTLLIIGGLNWGSVGLFQFDLVAFGLRRLGQHDKPGRLYSGGPVCRVVASLCCSGTGTRWRDTADRQAPQHFVQTGDGKHQMPPSPVLFLHFVRFY